jgi:hypothetical protein
MQVCIPKTCKKKKKWGKMRKEKVNFFTFLVFCKFLVCILASKKLEYRLEGVKMEKEAIMKELKAYEERRNEFYKFLDEHIPQNANTGIYDFSGKVMLDAQKVYELFHKLDYQARKIRGIVFNEIIEKRED